MLLTEAKIATLDALLATLVPTEPDAPGAEEVGLTDYLLHELAGDLSPFVPLYRDGLTALEDEARTLHENVSFADLPFEARTALLERLQRGESSADWKDVNPRQFLRIVAEHAAEGFYIHPLAWQSIGFEVTA